ncbi:hypothetical protein Srut_42310 [Streptomyces rutgersensis]|nr:hypothetical protein Srut_42310 [Streptomyces rutgersensis]
MIEVIAAMAGTGPHRSRQLSSARAMGSKGRLSGFGTGTTLPAGHIAVSPVSPFGRSGLPGRAAGGLGPGGGADRGDLPRGAAASPLTWAVPVRRSPGCARPRRAAPVFRGPRGLGGPPLRTSVRPLKEAGECPG